MVPTNDLNSDLDLASKVQKLLFPKASPQCSWCCMAVKNCMAKGLGGDFFDFVELPDGCQVVFLGDVTGHGMQASIVMALLYGYLHRAIAGGCPPRETVAQVNDFLLSFARRSRHLDHLFSTTLFYSVIEPNSLVMHYVNAGQVAPLVHRQDRILRLPPTAQPLGFFASPEIEVRMFQFQPGDRLLLYTDGIIEAFNGRGQVFGHAAVERLLLSHRDGPQDLLDGLFGQLAAFGGLYPPEDDCTAIALDFSTPHQFS